MRQPPAKDESRILKFFSARLSFLRDLPERAVDGSCGELILDALNSFSRHGTGISNIYGHTAIGGLRDIGLSGAVKFITNRETHQYDVESPLVPCLIIGSVALNASILLAKNVLGKCVLNGLAGPMK